MKCLITKKQLLKKYLGIKHFLNEKTRRLWCASEALAIGKHGVAMVSAVTKITPPTIYAGIRELKRKPNRKKSGQRIRKKGGGAKTILSKQPEISKELASLAEPATKGDPMSPLLWVSKSLRNLSRELKKKAYNVGYTTVSNLLKDAGYSLQLNRKEREGKSVPDRNAQFEHINEQAKIFLHEGQPVISVDTKKKELVGNYKNWGKEYTKKGKPVEVNMHDFPDEKEGKVAPYGVYDLSKNKGWVGVGITSDTAEFAVNTIRDWWKKMGKKDYPKASKLMITADCGGSNGNRVRLWKWGLQKLANELRMDIHVCHFPPGTSKWNKIEHKMFSYITLNWRGVPLISREAIVQLIGNTTTTTGLTIKSQIDYRKYEKGKEVSDRDFESIGIVPDKFHGEWNYRIEPTVRIGITL
ncbi:MAG TPA: ISAzo13 family transposase [Leptospiraceae bacterium]|nr:ISAzo13 family transposase [Leptospiraceae bacterium]